MFDDSYRYSGRRRIAGRQFAIGDIVDVDFGPWPEGLHIELADSAMGVCGGT